MVYIHSNLRLLTHKKQKYKGGSLKHWDVTLECTKLDATIDVLTRVTMNDDDQIPTPNVPSGSGTALGSNDFEFELEGNVDDLDLDPFDE